MKVIKEKIDMTNNNRNLKKFKDSNAMLNPVFKDAVDYTVDSEENLGKMFDEKEKELDGITPESNIPNKPKKSMYTERLVLDEVFDNEEDYYDDYDDYGDYEDYDGNGGDTYEVRAYYDSSYRGLADSRTFDWISDVENFCWEMSDCFIEVKNLKTGKSVRLGECDDDEEPYIWLDPISLIESRSTLKVKKVINEERRSKLSAAYDETVWDTVNDRLFPDDKNYRSLIAQSATVSYINDKGKKITEMSYPPEWYYTNSSWGDYDIGVAIEEDSQSNIAIATAKALQLDYKVVNLKTKNGDKKVIRIIIPDDVAETSIGDHLKSVGKEPKSLKMNTNKFNQTKKSGDMEDFV